MDTLIKDKLSKALAAKSKDINSFVWKNAKKLDKNGQFIQDETLLMNMSEQKLKECYQHCVTMLYNKDSQNPGRYIVLKIISEQKERCGVELFLRYLEKEHNTSRFSLITTINSFLTLNKEIFKNTVPILSMMYSNLPEEYCNLPIRLIMDGCLDRLGAFNKKHITRTFILKQGIWLTSSEIKEFADEVDVKNRIEVLREYLKLKDVEKLYINSRGINYTQMRAMLNIKPNKKYTELTTIQLETLRYRLLFNLEEAIEKHILSWEQRMDEIEQVAESKKFNL